MLDKSDDDLGSLFLRMDQVLESSCACLPSCVRPALLRLVPLDHNIHQPIRHHDELFDRLAVDKLLHLRIG